MEMTLRWAKRSKEYFEAHKEEVPWFRHSSFAIRSSPEPDSTVHLAASNSP